MASYIVQYLDFLFLASIARSPIEKALFRHFSFLIDKAPTGYYLDCECVLSYLFVVRCI